MTSIKHQYLLLPLIRGGGQRKENMIKEADFKRMEQNIKIKICIQKYRYIEGVEMCINA